MKSEFYLKNILWIFCLFFLVPIIFALKGNYGASEIILEILLCIFLLLYFFFFLNLENIKFSTYTSEQMICVHGFFLFFFIAALLSHITNKQHVVIIVLEGILFFVSFLYWCIQLKIKEFKDKIYSFYTNANLSLSVIIIFFVLLSLPCINHLYMWDSMIFANKLTLAASSFDFTFSNLHNLFFSHISVGFSYLSMFIFYCIGGNSNHIIIINIIFGVLTILFYHGILKELLPQISKISLFIFTGLLAFSPMFLGILGSYNLDFGMSCFFIWFVWAHLKKRYIFEGFFSFLLCTSKEPGILLCFGFLSGYYIFKMYKKVKVSSFSFKLLVKTLKPVEWITYLTPPILFLVLYFGNGLSPWLAGKDVTINVFGFYSWQYILQKLKTIFIIDFIWILWILFFAFLIIAIKKKEKFNQVEIFFSLIFSSSIYLIFNCNYVTYTHTRYVQANFYILGLLVTILGYNLLNNKIWNRIMLAIVILFFVQSFYNLDPLSNLIFDKYSIGNGTIISTRFFDKGYIYSDSNIYNRQYTYLNSTLNMALEEIDYDESVLIILSDIAYIYGKNNPDYVILGNWYEENKIYYNPQKHILENFDSENNLPFNVIYLNDEMDMDFISKYENVFYIDINYYSSGNENVFKEKYPQFYKNYICSKKYGTLKIDIYKYDENF